MLCSSLQSLLQLDRHTVYCIITNFMGTREEGEGVDARTTLGLSRLGEWLAFAFSEGSCFAWGELEGLRGWGNWADLVPC